MMIHWQLSKCDSGSPRGLDQLMFQEAKIPDNRKFQVAWSQNLIQTTKNIKWKEGDNYGSSTMKQQGRTWESQSCWAAPVFKTFLPLGCTLFFDKGGSSKGTAYLSWAGIEIADRAQILNNKTNHMIVYRPYDFDLGLLSLPHWLKNVKTWLEHLLWKCWPVYLAHIVAKLAVSFSS